MASWPVTLALDVEARVRCPRGTHFGGAGGRHCRRSLWRLRQRPNGVGIKFRSHFDAVVKSPKVTSNPAKSTPKWGSSQKQAIQTDVRSGSQPSQLLDSGPTLDSERTLETLQVRPPIQHPPWPRMKASGVSLFNRSIRFGAVRAARLLKCEHMSLRYCIPAARTQCPQAGRPSNNRSLGPSSAGAVVCPK
jgi:hypothetical protein